MQPENFPREIIAEMQWKVDKCEVKDDQGVFNLNDDCTQGARQYFIDNKFISKPIIVIKR